MKILILGGTIFLGRHLAELVVLRGHEVTLFNRGRHGDVMSDVEQLHGDRDSSLDILKNRKWDAVIDTSGYVPRVVHRSVSVLARSAAYYVFISSISVYKDFSETGMDETSPMGKLVNEAVEEVTGETYGPLKALCESVVRAEWPGKALIVRPGLLAGPYDPTDRFTYWPRRVRLGGPVLAPGNPDAQIQWIDVRDLAAWILDMIEKQAAGVFHATGPEKPLTMKHFLESSAAELNPEARFCWADEDFLLRNKVENWSEMPLWIAEKEKMPGFQRVDITRALDAGLNLRPIRDTIRDTAEWLKCIPTDHEWQAGMDLKREKELLGKLKDR